MARFTSVSASDFNGTETLLYAFLEGEQPLCLRPLIALRMKCTPTAAIHKQAYAGAVTAGAIYTTTLRLSFKMIKSVRKLRLTCGWHVCARRDWTLAPTRSRHSRMRSATPRLSSGTAPWASLSLRSLQRAPMASLTPSQSSHPRCAPDTVFR